MLDIFSKRLQLQLETLYTVSPQNWHEPDFKESIHGFVGLYSELYDFLVTDGHPIGLKQLDPKEKDRLWALANKKFKADNKNISKTQNVFKQELLRSKVPADEAERLSKEKSDEFIKKELHKVFKSFIVRKYLMDKVPTEGVIVLTANGKNLRELVK